MTFTIILPIKAVSNINASPHARRGSSKKLQANDENLFFTAHQTIRVQMGSPAMSLSTRTSLRP